MPLHNTGIMIGERQSALIVSPASAYLVCAQCCHGCAPAVWIIGEFWTDDPDCGTIFRNYDSAEIAKGEALSKATGCLAEKGVVFDVRTLAGFVK